ncbi:MAG: hypothetical protein OXC53_09505, partial [Rhodobacteraceae bacterium]|nr:hypothetical protein [Paracoccaceae bacterium]
SFITHRDQFEQDSGFRFILAQIAEIVADQQASRVPRAATAFSKHCRDFRTGTEVVPVNPMKPCARAGS